MINDIISDYSAQFMRYTQLKDGRFKRAAITLVDTIKGIDCITSLQSTLTNFRDHSFLLFNKVPSDQFFKILFSFKNTVNKRASIDLKVIHSQLDDISTNEQTAGLIGLLKEVLAMPELLLHNNALSLLNQMGTASDMQQIIDHLQEQPQRSRALLPRKGTFEATVPLSDQHKMCLDLLHNNSETFNEANINSKRANDLLQTLLIIYNDIHTPSPESQKRSSCTIQ